MTIIRYGRAGMAHFFWILKEGSVGIKHIYWVILGCLWCLVNGLWIIAKQVVSPLNRWNMATYQRSLRSLPWHSSTSVFFVQLVFQVGFEYRWRPKTNIRTFSWISKTKQKDGIFPKKIPFDILTESIDTNFGWIFLEGETSYT